MQLLGTTLAGRYRLDRILGEGGMATVFGGTDLLLNRPVAVKLLHRGLAGDPAVLARFWREAQAAAAISHPNVVAAYDFGEHDGTSFIVLELAGGEPLNELVAREGPLPPERAVAIISGVCGALHAAHARGLVHRDIKPGNVMVGPGDAVKVMDFGLAQAAEVACGLTDPGTVVGTAYYLSPEQAMGGEADARSDLYAVGVCLYELLTGERPFSGSTPPDIAIQHVSATPRALDELRPGLPPALVATVEQAMAKRPEARPPSAGALRERLERAVGMLPGVAPVDGAADAAGEATARLPAIAGASPPVALAADRTAPHAVVPRAAVGRAERLARSRAAERRLRRWLALLALALFAIAVGSATMLSLRAEPIAGPPGGSGADPRLTVTPVTKGGVTPTTRPGRGVAAPGQGRGGRAARPAQRREAKGKAKGRGGDQDDGHGDDKA
jgi:hypothetical protein